MTASNYSILHLSIGQGISTLALLLALGAMLQVRSKSWLAYSYFFIMTFLYGVMTFASSYVEEEQHFWYWMSSSWLVILWIKG